MKRSFTESCPIEGLEERVAKVYEDLKLNGYAVLPNVLSEEECRHGIDEVWKWLESLGTGIRRDDPKTWYGEGWPHNIHSIIQHHSVGQRQFVWEVRQHPTVMWVFTLLWRMHGYLVRDGPTDMLTSFDGMNITRPPELSPRGARPQDKSWLHADQGTALSERYGEKAICWQSLVTFEDCNGDEDATLLVLRGSHRRHSEFIKRYKIPRSTGNWVKCTPEQEEWLRAQDGLQEVRVSAPRGAMIFWDSRTFHQACAPRGSRREPRAHPDRFRYVVYVCMQPRELADAATLKKKREAFENYRMTSHWPAMMVRYFGESWQTYGNPVPPYKIVHDRVETLLMRRLAGL